MELKTRNAREEDREFIYTLTRTVYKELVEKQFGKWDEEWQRQCFEEKWQCANYQIIEKEGTRIGTMRVTHQDDHAFLNEIQLLPDFQGRGIGSKLIRRELERAHKHNIPLRLRVLKENRARSLYERLGFVVYGETDTHFLMESAV